MEALHAAFHRPETRIHRIVEPSIVVLVIFSLALLGAELVLDLTHETLERLALIDDVVLALFAVELCLRVGTYRPPEVDFFAGRLAQRIWHHFLGRLRFLMTPYMLIDLLTVAALVPALRGLRALRLLRLARGLRLFRYADPVFGLARAFHENRLLFTFAFALLGGSTIVGGISLFFIERGANPRIASPADGMWWAIVTLTTVGFGDITPVTGLGRIAGGVLMVVGMFTLAMFAGIVGHTLLHAVLGIREEQIRMSGYVDHIVICGYEEGAHMLLDTLLLEVDPDRNHVVLFGPGERPPDVGSEFAWVKGEPTKESELGKVRLGHARAVVIVGNRSRKPQEADATTILTIFTLRRWMDHNPPEATRRAPLYVVAEILDSENVDHARAAGADEVIESRRVGYSLLAHAVVMPGTAHIMSTVASAGEQSVYVCPNPLGAEAKTFGELAASVKASHGALLLGIRDPASGDDVLNPPESTPVAADASLIYICGAPVLSSRGA
ncbi:MAG: ion transporter [Planctomycetota bacterium]|jgi:voltage-gated potassium channel